MFRLLLLRILLDFLLVNASFEKFQSTNEAHWDIVRSFTSIIEDNNGLVHTDLHLAVWFNETNSKDSKSIIELSDGILKSLQTTDRLISVDYKSSIRFKAIVHYRLVLVDSLDSMKNIYSRMQRTENLSFTLIYFSKMIAIDYEMITKALHLCWELHIFNVGIIVSEKRNSSTEIVMFTYYPYTPNSCEIIKPIILNRFDKKRRFWQSRNYFPEKVQHFHGCTLKCAVWKNMPYFTVERNSTGHVVNLKGIEGHLIKLFARNLNFTIELYMLGYNERFRRFNDSEKFFKKLYDNNVSYVFGAFRFNSSSQFSQTTYYFVSQIYLVVNSINRHEWYKMLIRPLQPQVWLLIGLAFMLGYVVIFAAGHCNKPTCNLAFIIGHKKYATPFYNMFVTFLGGLIPYPLPKRNFARYIFILWLLMALVLRSAYQAGRYGILRDYRNEEVPRSLDEVARKNYIIEMIPENAWYLENLPEIKHVRFLRMSERDAFSVVVANESNERIGILTPYEYFGYFRKVNQTLSHRLSLVPERIVSVPLASYLPKHSFLFHMIDQQILWAQNHGFIDKWVRAYMEERKEKELGSERATAVMKDQSKETELNVLTMRELSGIFHLHLYLLLFACGVFIAELAFTFINLKLLRGKPK